MKNILQGIAILTHPIFLPILSLIIYAPLVASYGEQTWILASVWFGFVYLILPVLFFKVVRKIKLADPSLAERKSIYKAYTLVNLGFALVNVFLMTEYISFFLGSFLLHLILWFLSFIELKASWHTAAWSFLVSAGLMILFNYNFVGLPTMLAVACGILILVAVTRFYQKAHSSLELLVGVATGALTALPILFF